MAINLFECWNLKRLQLSSGTRSAAFLICQCESSSESASSHSLGRVSSPHKLLSTAKALVPQSHGCVDDVLAVPTHHHKPEETKKSESVQECTRISSLSKNVEKV